MLPGECVNENVTTCVECGADMWIDVHRSAAGYYIGFFCRNCGPYSRESGYYSTRAEALEVMRRGWYGR